jgi:26S proteasome regulatory subunit N9
VAPPHAVIYAPRAPGAPAAMASKPLEFIEALATQQPALAEDLSELGSLYQRKLWHQLTLKLEEVFARPELAKGDLAVKLYTGFVADFGAKLNLLRLAHLAVRASKSIKDPAAAVAFLNGALDKLAEWKLPRSEEPRLFLRMHVAEKQLEMGQVRGPPALGPTRRRGALPALSPAPRGAPPSSRARH